MLTSVRCAICRLKCANLKNLTAHYLANHSKFRIASQCIKNSMLTKVFHKARARKIMLPTKKLTLNKPETLYLNDNIQILCSQNKIIIGDAHNSLDVDLNFNDNKSLTTTSKRTKALDKCKKKLNFDSVEEKPGIRKMQHYRINIRKMKEEDQKTLDHINGTFYTCNCRKANGDFVITQEHNENNTCVDINKHTDSDKHTENNEHTENNKHTGNNEHTTETDDNGPLICCPECDTKVKTEQELAEHYKIHSITCRICSDIFPSKTALREHVQTHLLKIFVCYICQMEFFHKDTWKGHMDEHFEQHTLETVLDMEQDYTTVRYPFNGTHSENINSILYYLSDATELYYQNQRFAKIACDICYHEMYYGEYENHLQTVHFPYNY